MQSHEKNTKSSRPIKYTELPCEAPDGLCEILDFGAKLTIIDAVAGVNITMSKPGKFKEALIARNPDTIGCVVVLTFTVDDKDVIIKSVAGTLVIPSELQFNVMERIPEAPAPGVLNISIAVANESAIAFSTSNASIDIDKPCCLVVPPCQTGTATYVQRGIGFLDRPDILVSGAVIVIRLAWGAEEVKSVYYFTSQCGQRANRDVEIEYFLDAPYQNRRVIAFIPQVRP